MNFISSEFIILLVVTLALAAALRGRAVTYVVLAASVVFYGWWNPAYLWLLLAVIVLSWGGGLLVERRRSRMVLGLVVGSELALLVYFKYTGFLVGNLRAMGEWAGWPVSLAEPSVLLPVGISFMTFQGVAYVVDVYRGHLPAVRSFVDLALFKSFFPQLVAGPIERGPHLLPQLSRLESGFIRQAPLARATFMIMKGVIFKFVIADNLAAVVNGMYADVAAATPVDVTLGVVAFSIQIYGDFYGYTMIALGSALLFNVDLINNFQHPYAATSIQEFWRRWHISLSQWFRDYLYIPLGGSRVPLPRHLFNLLLVMFAVGLWHGASWAFVVWGAVHGLLLALHVLWRRASRELALPIPGFVSAGLGWVATFTVVTLAWIPFRAPDLATVPLVLDKLAVFVAAPFASASVVYGLPFYLWLGVAFIGLEVLDASTDLEQRFARLPLVGQAVVLFLMCVSTYLGPLTDVAFLYFQF